jgi:hypothetical protein
MVCPTFPTSRQLKTLTPRFFPLLRIPTPTPNSIQARCAPLLNSHRCATISSRNPSHHSQRLARENFFRPFSTILPPVAHLHFLQFSEKTSFPGRANHPSHNRPGNPSMNDPDRRNFLGDQVSVIAKLFRQSRKRPLGPRANAGRI